MNIPPEFVHEFDLDSLQLLMPRGRDFSMYVTPRYRIHYERELYEPLTADLLTSVLRQAELFLDIGANYGFFSMLAGRKHSTLEIISVEPTPVTCEVLARNAKLLGNLKIDVRQLAISDFIGRARFNIAFAADNCGFHEHPNAATIESIEVDTTTVDALLQNRKTCPLVVKIDTEGNELAVLRGMTETLNRFRDVKLIVGFNPATLRAAGVEPPVLLQYLDKLGFTVFMVDDNRRRFYRMKPETDCTGLMMYGYSNLYCVRSEQALSVCLFSHSSGLMGAERILLELVDDLIGEHGAVCTVVLPKPSPLAAKFEAAGAACVVSAYRWWCASASETLTEADKREGLRESIEGLMRAVMPVLRTFDPDVIWTQTIVIPWGAMLAALTGKPHVWYVLEYGERDHGLKFFSPMSTVIKEVVESSDLVFALSKSVKESLFPEFPSDRVRLLYCRVPPPPDSANAPADNYFRVPGAVRVGIFSQVRPSKGQEDIVRAMVQLVARSRNVELLIVGPGYPEFVAYLTGLAKNGGIEDRVKFVNFLENPYPAMRACDVVVVCSRAEALGRVGIEAMLLAKPVIYPMAGGVPEYMIDGKTGLSYAPGDVSGLVARLEELIGAPERWPIMGACGRAHAEKLFSREKFTGEVFRALQAIRRRGRTAGGIPKSIAKIVAEATEMGTPGPGEEAIETRMCRYGAMSLFKADTLISRALREYGEWAQAEIDFLLGFVEPNSIILDIGAFIGTHTLAFSRRASGGGKVYAFEPQPAFFELLKRNVLQNQLNNIALFNAGLSDMPGRMEVSAPVKQGGFNFGATALSQPSTGALEPAERVTVEVGTVDQLGLAACSLIKIDAEGMEVNVLRGARQTLRVTRPIVFAECNSLNSGWPVVEFMKSEGYAVLALSAQAFNPANFGQCGINYFGDARETGLLLIPQEDLAEMDSRLQNVQGNCFVVPIGSIDDLALVLLRQPQYKYEVLAKGRAARSLGVEFWANSTQLTAVLGEINALRAEVIKLRGHESKSENPL